MTSPGPYQTITKSRKNRALGSDDPGNNPGRPKNEGSDDPEASDKNNSKADVEASDVDDSEEDAKQDAEEDGLDNSDQSAGTNAS